MHPGQYKETLAQVFSDACKCLSPEAESAVIQKPRAPEHGDYACTAAMQLAPLLKNPPPVIADELLRRVEMPDFVESAKVIGGYINIRVKNSAKVGIVAEILNNPNYGRGTAKQEPLLLEFVSANPTGPLHVGHGRAAAYGDSLANLLSYAGHRVWREYYVNDAGRQAAILAASVWYRYFLEAAGETVSLPSGAYQGDYLKDTLPALASHLQSASPPPSGLADKLASLGEDKDAAADVLCEAMRESFADESTSKTFIAAAADAVLDIIKADLSSLGVRPFDKWFSEQTLQTDGKLTAAIDALRDKTPDSLYEQDGALWFRASAYGDDKDRVIRRANGQYTYFASDVAYHHDKFTREGAPRLINILGADHHGYVPRLAAVASAQGHDTSKLESQFIQLVAIIDRGQRSKMSTRAASFVPLLSLVDDIGADAARFFYVSRKNDQHLDFDLQLATERSSKNPVFYLQYAHARAAAVFRKWGGDKSVLHNADCLPLADDSAALHLCELLADYPEAIATTAKLRAVHLFASFMQELATAMHNYYEKTRILTGDNNAGDNNGGSNGGDDTQGDSQTIARLALLESARRVLQSGLDLLGITSPEQM